MRFWGKNLSSKIGISEQNPFTTEVSMPKSFHMAPLCPTFEKCQPTLMLHVIPVCHFEGLSIVEKNEIEKNYFFIGSTQN